MTNPAPLTSITGDEESPSVTDGLLEPQEVGGSETSWPTWGDRPTGTTLERIDNDGNYSPENCKWGTFGEQHRNRRSNTWITYNGETLIAKDWQNRTGIRADVITRRIARGVPLHEALTLKRTPRPAPTAMIEAAAKARRARTECKNGHPLSGDNLYVQPNGARVCKTCKHASYLTRRSAGKKA